MSNDIRYEETHTLPRWTWIICAVFVIFFWGIVYVQLGLSKPVGSKPMSNVGVVVFACIFGLILPLLLVLIRIRIQVGKDTLIIRIIPFYRKTFELQRIQLLTIEEVNPLKQFGGWGIRLNGEAVGYIFNGTGAIKLKLIDGSTYVISSNNPVDFHRVLKDTIEITKS